MRPDGGPSPPRQHEQQQLEGPGAALQGLNQCMRQNRAWAQAGYTPQTQQRRPLLQSCGRALTASSASTSSQVGDAGRATSGRCRRRKSKSALPGGVHAQTTRRRKCWST
eukprot:7106888-Pyramimonas_sp.AAC.1